MKNHVTDGEEALLPDYVQRVALNELHEDQERRIQSLEQLRNWLRKNPDVVNMKTDDNFLLRFLRFNKFSVPMSEQTILKYLNIRRTFPHLSTRLDVLDVKLNDIISSGYLFATPKRDSKGRRVIIVNAKHFNPKTYGCCEQARAHFLTYECLMEDPITQVIGLIHVVNLAGVTAQHITNWNPIEFARIFKWGEQSLPMRHKEIHLINVPTTLKWLIDFAKSRVSPKIRNRVSIYTKEQHLTKAVDSKCLPAELGGQIPLKDMIELWKTELLEKRTSILDVDRIILLSDRGIQRKSSFSRCDKAKSSSNFTKQVENIEGSFRKLEID